MYHPIDGGQIIEVPDNAFGFIFKCWVPPVGYGKNSQTGELCKTDILKRSDIPEEQYFERIKLPFNYKEKRKIEEQRQIYNPNYIDAELQRFRNEEWNRRLCGVWLWNYNPFKKESELIYITGQHWLYINWWKYQGKWNDFRITDRDCFYVVSYCTEDPYCLGENEVAKRKNGKTARVGCVAYERTSRLENHHAGIQSKTDDDAEEVFKKAVRDPWKILPHFYRPTYDLMKGDSPNDELRFFNTVRRGQNAEQEQTQEALNSWVDYKSRAVDGYDGPELGTYVSDESGKLKKDVSIIERQRRVRFSREDTGSYEDVLHLFTTTVEIEEDAKEEDYNDEFQELTKNSNPLERNANGHTGTGLYTYFIPAYKSTFFDKYGYPDEERAKNYFLNERKTLEEKGDLRGLSSFKRKNPFTLKEAFSTDGAKSLYNPELLNRQLEIIIWRNDLTEKGDLEWVNGDRFWTHERKENGEWMKVLGKMEWISNAYGKYEKAKGFVPIEPNNIFENYDEFYPNNSHAFRVGGDTFKFDKTKDKRRSNCAAFGYQIPDLLHPNVYDDYFTIRYLDRPEDTDTQHESLLKLCWWLGCLGLFERNVYEWKKYFTDAGCHNFLQYLPGEVEPGIYTDGQGNTTQAICTLTNAYINKHINKVLFKSLIQKESGWLGFKVEDTHKFDEPMAAGITLISVRGVKNESQAKLVDINDYFRSYKIGAK